MTPVVDSKNSQEVIQELKSGASFLDGSRGKEATLEYIDISLRDICGILEKCLIFKHN